MTTEVYLIGYQRLSPDRLIHICEGLGAYLVDVRYSPRSRLPVWNGSSLRARYPRYLHLRALGNRNYKGEGPIEIVDYAAGKAELEALDAPAVLMCVCHAPEGCHRTVVGEMLRADGFTVTELNLPTHPRNPAPADAPPAAQRGLFDDH